MRLKTNANRVMESGNHFKNGVSRKNLMSRGNNKMKQLLFRTTLLLSLVLVLNSCRSSKETLTEQQLQYESLATEGRTISINSEPAGAKVIANGTVVCLSTPCTVTLPSSITGKVEYTF
ncbi:MAG: PEGA domain-containing protein, partial [Tannerellaceae bacterium]|nr:PEGA domain-containing protein [Tannerellaceae bacterium]